MTSLRVDLIFSYWIYLWYILYILKIISYSPKFPLILGLIDNIIMLFLMLIYGTSLSTIIYFVIINTLIKILPLYYLKNEVIKTRDIYFTVFLFIIFVLWIHINKESLFGNIKLIHDSLLFEQNKTPFMAFINNFKTNFKNLKYL